MTNTDQLLKTKIEQLIYQHGSLRAAARVLKIDPAYLHRLLNGEKNAPSEKILRKLGLKRIVVITYENI